LGCKYLRQGNDELAVSEMLKAVELDPGSSRAYSNLTIIYLRLGKVPEADAAAKRALTLDGSSPLAHYVMGMARLAERRFDKETLQHLEVARQQFPYAERPAAALRSTLTNSLVKR